MGPFTALMTVEHAGIETAGERNSLIRKGATWLGALLQTIRTEAQNRRLRDQLADMDTSMLRDIGIADDEIHMIRARSKFTPRGWADRGIGANH